MDMQGGLQRGVIGWTPLRKELRLLGRNLVRASEASLPPSTTWMGWGPVLLS